MTNVDLKFEALCKQCDIFDSKITSYSLLSLRVLGLGTTIIIGLLVLAIKEHVEIALLLLPFAMYAILFYWINITTWILAFGGYKRHLEERINRLVNEPLFLWESRLVHSRHVNVANSIMNMLSAIVLIGSITVSLYSAHKMNNILLIVSLICLNLIFLAALGYAIGYMRAEFDRTYLEAQAYCNEPIGQIRNEEN